VVEARVDIARQAPTLGVIPTVSNLLIAVDAPHAGAARFAERSSFGVGRPRRPRLDEGARGDGSAACRVASREGGLVT
jgi:hypothetical protein